MDFSKTENIIFVSVVGAAILFFLATTIAVIAKGKRTCKAGDVLLRIASALVFACSAVLVVCVIMSQLTGSYRIDATDTPTLYLGSKSVVLPVPQLFAALATTVGSNLITGLFIVSLVALVCDCMLANKKKVKASRVVETDNAERSDNVSNVAADNATVTDTAAVRDTADEISDDEFKNGDAFDAEEDAEEPEKNENVAADYDTETAERFDDGQDDKPWYNEDGEFDLDERAADEKEPNASSAEQSRDESDAYSQSESEPDLDSESYSGTDYENESDTYNKVADDGDTFDIVDERADYSEVESDDSAQVDESDYEADAEDDADNAYNDESEPVSEIEEEDEATRGERELEEFLNEPFVEPDRDIYIPEIRTVKRGDKSEKPKSSGKTAQPAKTVAPKSAASKKSAEKGKKPKKTEKQKTDNKSLPVGRRYVIIDRRSAVNIFSDYLKERDKQDKEKLESSINKIILK